jgi:glutaminyl-peptide cyclotransferase
MYNFRALCDMHRFLIIISIILISQGCTNNPVAEKRAVHRFDNQIQTIKFSVVKTYPHDSGSFTEGFIFHNNQLFESTGSPDDFPETRSVFGIVDLKTGKIDIKAELDRNKFFGEGIVFLRDRIYQVTYENQTCFVYDAETYAKVDSYKYKNKEGWGLTTDGKSIIMSDGTNIITWLDPDSLNVIKTLNITFNGASALYMNELEYINGYLYANIWTTDNIAKIDPETGRIVGIIDLSSLYVEAKKKYALSEATNGIAFDSSHDRIFVTGKFWPVIYQIKFPH